MRILVYLPESSIPPLPHKLIKGLLPICGKSILEHNLEWLSNYSFPVSIVSHQPLDGIEGQRWGLELEIVPELPQVIYEKNQDYLMVHGDWLNNYDLSRITEFELSLSSICVERHHSAIYCGSRNLIDIRLLNRTILEFGLTLSGYSLPLHSWQEFADANFKLLNGELSGLRPSGLSLKKDIIRDMGNTFHSESLVHGPIHIGRHSEIDKTVRIMGKSIIASKVIIDKNTELSNCIILPNTYIGKNLRINNKIVWGNLLIDLDSSHVTQVQDQLLLAFC